MIIISQTDSLAFDFHQATRFTLDPAKNAVFAKFSDGHGELLGVYDEKSHAKHVIGMMVTAYCEGRTVFHMPDQVDVRAELMNRHCQPVRSTGAGKSHGGT